MALMEFYQGILGTFGVVINEEGYLKRKLGEGELAPITRMKGMHIKLPTKENLNNMYHPDADGKFVRSYLLFNPLSESAYEDGYSLELMIDLLKISLSTSLAALGDLLLIAYSQPKLQHDIPLELQEFIGNAKDKSIVGMKATGKAIDDTMLEKWKKFIGSFDTLVEKEMFNIVVARTKRIGDAMSNTREARCTFGAYKELTEALGSESNVTINGISLRPKDVKIFLDIINLFMKDHDENGLVKEGTQDTVAPGFISLMKLAMKLLKPASRYIKALAQSNPLYIDSIVEFTIDVPTLEASPEVYKKELLSIPSDAEMNKGTNVLNAKQGTNLNARNLHTAVAAATTQPLDYVPDEPKSGADYLLRKRHAMDEQAVYMQASMTGGFMARPNPRAVVMPKRPGMVSRLTPQLNSVEASQQYAQEQYMGQQTQGMYNAQMQQRVIGGIGYGMGMNTGMNTMPQGFGMGNSLGSGTYVGAYGTYNYGTGWGR